MPTLTLEAASPAVSARIAITTNAVVVGFIVDTITSTSLRLYGAATSSSTLHPLVDASLSEFDISVASNKCVIFEKVLQGFNYFAVLPDQTEAAQRTITVLTVPQ